MTDSNIEDESLIDRIANAVNKQYAITFAFFIVFLNVVSLRDAYEFVYMGFIYNGNSDIVFLKYEERDEEDVEIEKDAFLRVFDMPELKGKYVFLTSQIHVKRSSAFLAMEEIQKKYSDKGLVFLYMVEGIGWDRRAEWKKIVRDYNLKGYHINVPATYRPNIHRESYTKMWPAWYMLISDKGEIAVDFLPPPNQTEDLVKILDEWLVD